MYMPPKGLGTILVMVFLFLLFFLTQCGSGGASTGFAWPLCFSFSDAPQGFLLHAPESVD